LNAKRQKGYANVESKLRFPHSHSLDGYGLLSETQPTTFPIFNVAGMCEKYWTLPIASINLATSSADTDFVPQAFWHFSGRQNPRLQSLEI
jgi:hypothetical protein